MKRNHEDAVADDITQGRLIYAAEQVLKTKNITPLLKEELRLSILVRRHAQGADAIKAEFKNPETYELTPAEIEKKKRRREQNRKAAQRCRMKKKMKQDGWMQNFSKIIEENQKLSEEIETLKQQKLELHELLQQHQLSGKCWYNQDTIAATPALDTIQHQHEHHHHQHQTVQQNYHHEQQNQLHLQLQQQQQQQHQQQQRQRPDDVCDELDGNASAMSQLWPGGSPALPCRMSSSSFTSSDSDDLNNMLSLSDMDFPSHPQMDELLYHDVADDSRRQGLSTSSLSSDCDGLSAFVVADPVQDDDVFHAASQQRQLSEMQAGLLYEDAEMVVQQQQQQQQRRRRRRNQLTCEKQSNEEKCFYSEP